jgi:dihydropyrimidinase
MSKVIKGGTIVAADRRYEADVLIEGETIAEIGPNLSGDETIEADGAYVIPGGVDPHCHLEMPFMGTFSADDFESGTRAAASGGTTTVVDFCLPAPGESLLDAWKTWDAKSAHKACVDYSYHQAITW